MATIGLIDDDTLKRGTLRKSLERVLKDEASFVDIFPLDDPRDYVAWIAKENIHAIVMDWRLNEQSFEKQGPVSYTGDAVVKALRAKRPFFPIFVLTAYSKSEEVEAHSSEVEYIEDRGDFTKSGDKLIRRLVRAAASFSDSQQKKLARITELAKASAVGKATTKDKEELKKLQAELNLSVVSDAALTQSSALGDAEKLVDSADDLIRRIEAKLAEKKA